jgi:hypothetical protein
MHEAAEVRRRFRLGIEAALNVFHILFVDFFILRQVPDFDFCHFKHLLSLLKLSASFYIGLRDDDAFIELQS